MNINDFYSSSSDYLKAEHLPPGREVQATIERFEEIELDNKKKICLRFRGKEKGLVLNKTNAMSIAHVYGPDCHDWTNRDIIMFSTKVDYAGQMVDAIRVRLPLQPVSGDDDIPGFD